MGLPEVDLFLNLRHSHNQKIKTELSSLYSKVHNTFLILHFKLIVLGRQYLLAIVAIVLIITVISILPESSGVDKFKEEVKIIQGSSSGTNPNNDKVTICHNPSSGSNNPKTITVSENAANSHFAHGDTPGPCVANVNQGQDSDRFSGEAQTTSNTSITGIKDSSTQDSDRSSTEAPAPIASPSAITGTPNPLFTDVTASAGINFQHFRGNDLFSMGAGVALFYFNNDNLLDIYDTN